MGMASAAPIPGPEICPEKQQLMHAYEIAASDYSRAVLVLSQRGGVLSRADYVRIRDYSEKARIKAEATRNAMDRHIADHGC